MDMFEKNTERLWDQLIEFIEDGRVIPIIGPELLKLNIEGKATFLCTYLAEQLANRLQVDSEPTDTLNQVACRYITQGGQREDIYPEIKHVMPSLTEAELPEALIKLAEIRPLKLFVTTCFDPLLAQVLNQVRYGGKVNTQVLEFYPGVDLDNDLPVALKDLHRTTVFHLFGKMSAAPEYAVTDEDVLEFMHKLQSKTSRPARLFDALIKEDLMVIGCPLSDWLGRFFVRLGKKGRLVTSGGKTDFLAGDQFQIESNLTQFLNNFSRRTKVFPMASIEFVNELHRRWIALHPPSLHDDEPIPVLETPHLKPATPLASMHNGAVFLSYASEDRSAVMLIQEALEQAGIDVWFDRNPEALRPGDNFANKIKSNIDKCSLFIPIISQHTLTPRPRFFRTEWNYAQDVSARYPDNWRYIIPVVIDDTSPESTTIPEMFRQLHWENMQGGQTRVEFVNEIKRLYRDYQRSLAQST